MLLPGLRDGKNSAYLQSNQRNGVTTNQFESNPKGSKLFLGDSLFFYSMGGFGMLMLMHPGGILL